MSEYIMENGNMITKRNREELQKMSFLIRYNNRRRIFDESVAEHSFYTSMFVITLCDILNVEENLRIICLEMALTHDISEIVTSDVPHPVKKMFGSIDETFNRFEDEFNSNNFKHLYKLIENEDSEEINKCKFIVKLADIISVKQYAEQEVKFGNSEEFRDVLSNTANRINDLIICLKNYYSESQIYQITSCII